jgi:hypothetical protein
VVYRYSDADGQWVYVNDLSLVPAERQGGVERLTLGPATPARKRKKAKDEGALGKARALTREGRAAAEGVQREVGDVLPFVHDLDLPSVAVGFALALVPLLAVLLVRRTGRLVLTLGLVAAIFALVAGAYFGWLRQAAGLSGGGLASPQQLVDDAKRAADEMQDRLQHNERVLRQLEETSR